MSYNYYRTMFKPLKGGIFEKYYKQIFLFC